MEEETVPSIFASIRSFFTPTVLFLLLNLVIGTIAITSKNRRRHRRQDLHPAATASGVSSTIYRSSSSNVVDLVKSIGIFRFRSGEIPAETLADPPESAVDSTISRSSSTVLDLVKSIPLFRFRSGEIPPEIPQIPAAAATENAEHRFGRSQSESSHAPSTERPAADRMKKSASAVSARAKFEKESDRMVRRPLRAAAAADEEVDVRADDFINRFRQELRLQRLNSIMEYKEMIDRGK